MSFPSPQSTVIPRTMTTGAPHGLPSRPAVPGGGYASQAARYRSAELAGATPGQLVVLLFDRILLTLRRARLAIDARRVEERVDLLLSANEMISELRLGLDFEQGGVIAHDLDALYAFALRQLFEASRSADAAPVDSVLRILGDVRDAFAQIVGSAPGAPGAVPAAPTARSA